MTQRESLETRHLRMSGFSLRGRLSAKTYKEERKEGVVVSRRGAKAQSRGAKVQSYFFFHEYYLHSKCPEPETSRRRPSEQVALCESLRLCAEPTAQSWFWLPTRA